MLYHWYELGRAAVRPARAAAELDAGCSSIRSIPDAHAVRPQRHRRLRGVRARDAALPQAGFGITPHAVDRVPVRVTEEVVWERPSAGWCTSSATSTRAAPPQHPRLLLVAPMSGHFATLLRGTVETFLPDHEVYITDWQDARDVPLSAGRFDLDDYIDMMATCSASSAATCMCSPCASRRCRCWRPPR